MTNIGGKKTTLQQKKKKTKVRRRNKDVSDLSLLWTKKCYGIVKGLGFFSLFSQRKASLFMRLMIIRLMLLCLTSEFIFQNALLANKCQ